MGPSTMRSFAPTMATVTHPTATYATVAPTPIAPKVPPQTASSTAMRANAEQALTGARNTYRDSLFRAIMNLGDTSQFAKYQADPMFAGYTFTQDPNSLFAQLQRQQDLGLKQTDENTLAGNTFFSGRRVTDRQNLIDEANRQRLQGSTDFTDNLRTLAGALTGAEGDYRQAMADADQADIDAQLQAARDNRAALNGAGPSKGILAGVSSAPTPPPPRTRAQQQAAAAAFARAQAQAQEREAEAEARARARARTKNKGRR